MGLVYSLFPPDPEPQTRRTGRFDTSNCKSGCKAILYDKDGDSLFKHAVKKSVICTKFLLLKLSINDTNSCLFILGKDVLVEMSRIHVEYGVYDRIQSSQSLPNPWTLKSWKPEYDFYDLNAPSLCEYGSNKAYVSRINSNGNMYRISNYFWVDEIYHTDICKCECYMFFKAMEDAECQKLHDKMEKWSVRTGIPVYKR